MTTDHVYFPEPNSGRCVANGDEPLCTLSADQHQPAADLAAANATIEALQADLAGTAELLLREQALAESRSLALATMREALSELLESHDNLYVAHFGDVVRSGVRPEDDIAAKPARAILDQPADAAALAGAVLAAADRMADGVISEWHAGTDVVRQWCRTCGTWPPPPSTAFLHREDCPVEDYRRARAALCGSQA